MLEVENKISYQLIDKTRGYWPESGEATPAIIKRIGELAMQAGGHGGMDFLLDWRTIDCLRNGLTPDQNLYDAALWNLIFPLSELPVNNRSNSIKAPDFTAESWKTAGLGYKYIKRWEYTNRNLNLNNTRVISY